MLSQTIPLAPHDSGDMSEVLGMPVFPEDETGKRRRLAFLGYFPCPIRDQVRTVLHELVRSRFSTEPGGGSALPWYVPGGCGGKDVYEELWRVTDENELPDIILSVDFGDYWRPEFQKKFVESGLFEPVGPKIINPAFNKAGMAPSPSGYTLFAGFPYVMLVDTTRLGGRKLPEHWDDLLLPEWKDEVSIGGSRDDISTLILIHLWRSHGDAGLKTLAGNIKSLRHSAQMAKLAGSGNPDASAISVLPWFFADSCPHTDKTNIVVPLEGSLVSPIYVLAKRTRSTASNALLNALFSPEVAEVCHDNWFPSAVVPVHTRATQARLDDVSLIWPGWEFLQSIDIPETKLHVERVFRSVWKGIAG